MSESMMPTGMEMIVRLKALPVQKRNSSMTRPSPLSRIDMWANVVTVFTREIALAVRVVVFKPSSSRPSHP